MPHGEFLVGSNLAMEGLGMPLQVLTTNLGENNVGPYGPADIDSHKQAQIIEANANAEYRRPASNRYICVDGRSTQVEHEEADMDHSEYDPQMAGGEGVLETVKYLMTTNDPQPLSVVVPEGVKRVIENGRRVTVHGANGKLDACAANAEMRNVLRENSANMDIVVPIAFSVNEGLGIAEFVSAQQLAEMVVTGNRAADKDTVWDLDAIGVTNAIKDAGGEYLDYVGDHHEKAIRADLQEGAIKKAKLTKDLSDELKTVQQFIASLGQYKKDIFEQFAKNGQSEAEAAADVAKAVLYTIGISKHLSAKEMPVHLVS